MSRYSDINQLLEEIGTSARSASDPWTLSRSYRGTVARDSFSPAVIADMGAPRQELTSGIQSSEQITNADIVASSPGSASGSGSTSTGSGFLGGLLNVFPLASGIAKLFGLGNSSSPPALTPYEPAPSINFEGAMSGVGSRVTSLSYGDDGLPRTSAATNSPIALFDRPPSSNFDGSPAEVLRNIGGIPNTGTNLTGIMGQLESASVSNVPDEASTTPADGGRMNGSTTGNQSVITQLMTLVSSALSTDVSETNSTFDSGLTSMGIESSDARSLSLQQSFAGNSMTASVDHPASVGSSMPPGGSSSGSQQGQSVLVQVQAMDSQSFMDHSQEIAQAVRQAMLNMNSLNDVILDL